MPVQVFLETRHITSRAVRRIIKRGGLAAIAAGLGVISLSMYGVDPAVGYSQALAAAPHSSPTGRRSMPASPINLQVREPNRQLQPRGTGRSTLRRFDALIRMQADAEQNLDRGMLKIALVPAIQRKRSASR